ncbi:hypothetical protein PTTG_02807, partial [Puccinia triticina 1-1 BBBD Race 1]
MDAPILLGIPPPPSTGLHVFIQDIWDDLSTTDLQASKPPTPHSSDANSPPRILDDADNPAPRSDNDSKTNLPLALAKGPVEGFVAVGDPVPRDIPPAKRQRLHQADFNLSMEQFFLISHLKGNEKHTISIIKKHSIYHWSAFKGM